MKSPIAEYKEQDANDIRDTYIAIINEKCKHCGEDDPSSKKDKIESGKNLARMHHLLQPDRTIVSKSNMEKVNTGIPELKPEHKKKMQGMIDGVLPS